MIEEQLFKEYRDYLKEKSIFKDKLKIVSSTPNSLANFPTIIMRQINESDYIQGKTVDRLEQVSRIYYRVSIYTKPTEVGGVKYQPKQIINEIRDLTYKFFNNVGLDKDSDTPADNIDLSISRQEMIFSGRLASWNNSLYF